MWGCPALKHARLARAYIRSLKHSRCTQLDASAMRLSFRASIELDAEGGCLSRGGHTWLTLQARAWLTFRGKLEEAGVGRFLDVTDLPPMRRAPCRPCSRSQRQLLAA